MTPRPNLDISVSLVTYNGMRWLPACLASVRDQDGINLELLVIDNGSTDGSAAWLAEQALSEARLHVQLWSDNRGFAAAHNQNIDMAQAEHILLVNQDVVLAADYLRRVVDVFAANRRVGSVQGHIWRLTPDAERLPTVDTTGLLMQRGRRVLSRDQGTLQPMPERPRGPVWGVDGPVAAYRREALLDSRLPRNGGGWEVLDEDFFMYKEDVDLAWRLRLLGWNAVYEPGARAWHARAGSGAAGSGWLGLIRSKRAQPGWIRSLSWRNQRLMQAKNENLAEFVADLPWIVSRELLDDGLTLAVDLGRAGASIGLAGLLPGALNKRRHLQRRVIGRQ